MTSKVWRRRDLAALVAQGLQLGNAAFIADDVYLDPGHPWLISIGDHATLAPGVAVLAHDACMRRHIGHTLIARVEIGERAFIGAHAILLPGTTIGDDAIVGAGAVVRGNIPPAAVVIGNPATVVGDLRSFLDRHCEAIADAPVWPHQGWMAGRGITLARRRTQREALVDGTVGYLRGSELVAEDPASLS